MFWKCAIFCLQFKRKTYEGGLRGCYKAECRKRSFMDKKKEYNYPICLRSTLVKKVKDKEIAITIFPFNMLYQLDCTSNKQSLCYEK